MPQSSIIIEPEILLGAYASGYFPMAQSRRSNNVGWFSPDPRAIIPLGGLKISRSLRQSLKKNVFTLRIDSSFEEVMAACADREETWISDVLIRSYVRLHRLGFAHSVEVWAGNDLRGGLYGVALGAAFFGESMFSRTREASKIALVHLVERLNERNYELLDTQFLTPHLARLGAREIPRKEYLRLLARAMSHDRSFGN